MLTSILFDVGDTLVHAAPPATPTASLVASPIGDTVAVLRALGRRFRLGAVTDTATMTEADVRTLLAPCGLDELLEVVVTSSDIGVAKPDPAGLRLAMDRLGVTAGETLFVGDNPADREAALAAGVAFALAGGGRSPRESVRTVLTEREGAAAAALALVGELDRPAMAEATERQQRLTKPQGALGRLEGLSIQLAGIAAACPPPIPAPAAVGVFAGDHGVLAQGVSPWPQEVTAQMVANFCGGGAAINVLARQVGASVTVVDVGVATDLAAMGLGPASVTGEGLRLVSRNVRAGTADLSTGPAMTAAEARAALDAGAAVATELVEAGAAALVTGEMGIGNTTPSAALIAALTGRPAELVTGRGTGIDDETLARKVAAVDAGLARLAARPDHTDPLVALAEVGGLEIAALAGFILAGASHRVPVVVDGVIAGAALLVASALCPTVSGFVVAGHRSTEPGATALLDHLGLDPVLDLGLRLGEGSGACLAVTVVEAAARILNEMATFDGAGVSEKGA